MAGGPELIELAGVIMIQNQPKLMVVRKFCARWEKGLFGGCGTNVQLSVGLNGKSLAVFGFKLCTHAMNVLAGHFISSTFASGYVR